MKNIQKYGIKYPFTSDNEDGIFLDLNNSLADGVKSRVLHVIFTPKGQKLRDPNFGTDLIKFIFQPNDNITMEGIKNEINNQIMKYVPEVIFKDVRIYKSDGEKNEIIVSIEYGVKNGNKQELTTVSVKL